MVYPIAKKIIRAVVNPWFGKCKGIENIPNSGVILAANHASYLDHFIIGCNVVSHFNKYLYFLAKKEHFESFIQRTWHNYLRAIPLDRKAGGRKALKHAIDHLNKGDIIMIYPEGTRTLSGKMNKGKTGAVRLALAAKSPIVPMGVTNTFKILPKGKRIPKRGLKSDLNIGKPLYYDKYFGQEENPKIVNKLTDILMHKIAELAKQKYDPKK